MPEFQRSKLLVEGIDDQRVIEHLLKRLRVDHSIHIKAKSGISSLRESIYSEANSSGLCQLGIVADANDNPADRWRSISSELERAGCQVPDTVSSGGSLFPGPRNSTVGVWLMPDNIRSGELEDFLQDMIPADDTALFLAKSYIDSIPEKDRKFKENKTVRAYVHAWLASRKKPRRAGLAISAGDLHLDGCLARSFVSWLCRLYKIDCHGE